MLFSEAYKLGDVKEDGWFDPELKWDTELFVDVILVFKTEMEEFQKSKEKIKEFFNNIFGKVASARGENYDKRSKGVLRLLEFREPSEICLGYTNFGQQGSGIGRNFSRKIFHAVVDFIEMGLENFEEYISSFELFAEGIGPDRLSDMITNIIKKDLIEYTQKICAEKQIPTTEFLVSNVDFDFSSGWTPKRVSLPKNPLNNRAIILVPKDFIRARRNVGEDFISYIYSLDNDTLRNQATRVITENLNKKQLRERANKNKSLFKELLKKYFDDVKKERQPYDTQNDPLLLWKFKGDLEKIKETLIGFKIEQKDKDSLIKFVEDIISEFRKRVESNEGYYLLFNDDGKPRGERAAQILFWAIAETICKKSPNSPDISPESKTGKGLIDFKFSEGYSNRILVELKLVKNPKLYHGLEKQLFTYLAAAEIERGYYVVIKQVEGDHVRTINLEEKYANLEEKIRNKIKIEIVDASDHTTGSKIK